MRMPTSPSEPIRLLQESDSSLERSLLGAGKSYASSAQTRVKVLAGLGLAAGSTALLTGSAVASTAAKLTWGKLLVGVSLVGAVSVVPVGYYALRHPGAPANAPAHRSIATSATSAEAAAAPDTQDIPQAARTAMLSEELGALDRARLALAGGDARRALDALDGYDRRFPAGRLQTRGRGAAHRRAGQDRPQGRRPPARRGIPAAPPEQRSRDARTRARRRLSGPMRASWPGVALAATLFVLASCTTTVDSIGYNASGGVHLRPVTGPATYPNPFKDLQKSDADDREQDRRGVQSAVLRRCGPGGDLRPDGRAIRRASRTFCTATCAPRGSAWR